MEITTVQIRQHSPIKFKDELTYNIFLPYMDIANLLYFNNEAEEKDIPSLIIYAIYQALPFHWKSIANKEMSINNDAIDITNMWEVREYLKMEADKLKQKKNSN